jgi:hypothetical protein
VQTQIRYTKFGNGNAITGFAGRVGTSSFEVSSHTGELEVIMNGKVLGPHTRGDAPELIVIRKGPKKSDVIVDARGVFRASIVFDPVTKTLDVNLNIQDKIKKFGGILKDGKGKVHRIRSESKSMFRHFVRFERVSGKPLPEFKENAEKWCADVLPRWVKECKKDVMVTGINWSNNYRLERADRNDAMKTGAFTNKA